MVRTYASMCVLVLLVACGQKSGDQRPVDEVHRPSDWVSHMELSLAKDTIDDGYEQLKIVQSSHSGSFEELVDQLFQLTFSGDAEVFGVNLFGEMDEERPLSPERLLNELQRFDTITVEDLVSGAQVDTVVDLSFGRSQVSAITLFLKCGASANATVQFQPYAVALGKKVYNETTGEYRGVSQQFYIRLQHAAAAIEMPVYQRFHVLSDSLGLFRPAYFDFHSESGQPLFQKLLERSATTSDSTIQLDFDMRLDYIGQRMRIDEVKVGGANGPT